MVRRNGSVELTDLAPDFHPNLVNKKATVTSDDPDARATSLRLQAEGYRVPSHWRNAARERPFFAWDGEGITYPGFVEQSYVLFGCSSGDRVSKPSLGTVDCLDLLLAVESANPDAIHVGFALQYDCNMILKDLDRRHIERIYRTHKCYWEGYRIEYRPGKWLSIRRNGVRARLFDVLGFFQASFVSACEKFLGKDDPELVQIREGKAARQSFKYDQLEPFIVPYWEAELRLLVRLMDSLRDDLTEAGMKLNSWHGPGAVANVVLRGNNIQLAKSDPPEEVNRAAQYAYAGGRFELFQCGHYPDTVYEYDLNSAYPAAIAGLPNLQGATWKYVSDWQPASFGVWHIRHDARSNVRSLFTNPQPFYVRDRHGNVSYPPLAEGWYWQPESAIAANQGAQVVGGWILEHDGSEPFAFIREMYETRQQWKQQGNSAERALKLALNSLYGKMAQRAGWLEDGDPIPRWHQLEWAGFVTSVTRAKLWDAISLQPTSIISVETDALFTSEPLNLPIGTELGQWSETVFDWITYLQNGLYYAGQGSEIVEKYRGFDKGSLPYSRVMDYLRALDGGKNVHLHGSTTRFIGMGTALHTRARWCSWQTDERRVQLGGGGKRAHVPGLCSSCKAGVPLAEGLHPMAVITPGGRSEPHSLPWLASREPELRKLDELERW